MLNNLTLEKLSQLLQVILGGATVLYVLGYLSWALFAWHNHLGFLPALKEQYLVAGVVPLFILLIVGFSFWLIWQFAYYKIQSNTRIIIAYTIILFFVVIIIITERKVLKLGTVPLVSLSFLLAVISLMGLADAKHFLSAPISRVVKFIWVFIMLAAAVGVLSSGYFSVKWQLEYYTTILFPQLPRELGGPETTCITLDIDRNQYSDRTLTEVCANTWVGEAGVDVIRSEPLYIIFDAGEYLILKHDSTDISATNPAFRLKSSGVSGIYPCN